MAWAVSFESSRHLKACRMAVNWTQRDLARASGHHVQTVKYHEAKPGKIDGVAPAHFKDALRAAGVDISDVWTGADNTAHEQAVRADLLTSFVCGAATRAKGSCQCKPVPGRVRCRLHGGLSTGPKSEAGKGKIRASQRSRWDSWKLQKQSSGLKQVQ